MSEEAPIAGFFDDLVRCETRLYNALNERLRDQHGIVTSQFDFLRYLRHHPASRVADLAAVFAIGNGATSKGIDRLEHRGWVERQPNPADRRSSLLALTDEGTRLAAAAEQTVTDTLDALVRLTPSQLDATAEALRLLRTQLEDKQVGIPTG